MSEKLSTLDQLLLEFEKHKGELVLIHGEKVLRFIGIGMDDWDYFYILFDGTSLLLNTVLDRMHILKDKIDHYNDMVRIVKLNHYDQIRKDEFNELLKPILITPSKGNTYLTELYFELN